MAQHVENKQNKAWLGQLLAGDHQAFAEFVGKHRQSVFLCCRKFGLREDQAEDVASETFLAAYTSLSKYKGHAQLKTWLYRIAYNKTVSYLRTNNRWGKSLCEFNTPSAQSRQQTPPAQLYRKEKRTVVWAAVDKLPRVWGTAVILYYSRQQSIAEIARTMQLRQNTVKTYLFRARKRLKPILQPFIQDTAPA